MMAQNSSINPRTLAFNILYKVSEDKAYSNIAVNTMLKESGLSGLDSAFVSAIVYGVLEKQITIDYIIRQYSNLPMRKIEIKTLIILRMGIYQMLFMDKVPDSAAVNESVKIAKKKGLMKSCGFINAVLRNFVRADKKYSLPPESERVKYLSVKYSCPESLISQWLDAYGYDITVDMLKSLEGRPPVTVKVNTLKISLAELIKVFEEEGVKAERNLIPQSLNIKFLGSIENLKSFKEGYFHVQDGAGTLCALTANPKRGDVVYDICSAPGGKAFSMAEIMENEGELYCFDLYEHKLRLIEKGAKRLGLNIIKTAVRNGANPQNKEEKPADVILCDVPCSGTGILRRKPEIRYKDNQYDENLTDIQYKILTESAKLLKEGGKLVYSTCTLNPLENANVVKRFLKENKNFSGKALELPKDIKRTIKEEEYEITLFPQTNGTDGFYIALLQKG